MRHQPLWWILLNEFINICLSVGAGACTALALQRWGSVAMLTGFWVVLILTSLAVHYIDTRLFR